MIRVHNTVVRLSLVWHVCRSVTLLNLPRFLKQNFNTNALDRKKRKKKRRVTQVKSV